MGCCPSPAVVVLLAVAVYLLLASNVPDELLDYLDGAEAYNKDVEFLHHPFLAPVPAAQTNRTVAAHVTGKLPPELDGLYVRNGPNPLVRTSRYHWFDGDSLLHAVWLEPQTNTAVYGNAPPQTPSVVDDNRAGRRRSVGLGSLYGRTGLARFVLAALRGLLGIVSAASPITNSNANTAVLFHHGKLYALVEANLPYEVSIRPRPSGDSAPREPLLDSVGHDTLGDKWHYSFTAHPKVDPVTGELIFFGAYPGAQPLADYIQYGVADSKGNVKSVLKVPLKTPGIRMMHDCAFTEHFTLFLDFPLYLEPLGLASGKPLVNYYGEQKAFIGVLPRHATNGSDVKWYEVGVGGYVYHVGNAYEEGDTIVVDMTYYKSAGGWGGYTEQSTAFQHPGLPWRFIINRKTGDVQSTPHWTAEQQGDIWATEFPHVNHDRAGRKHSVLYHVGISRDNQGHIMPDTLLKSKATEEGWSVQRFRGPHKGFFHEAVFVPRASASSEDDGYLVGFVFRPDKETTSLVVWDAKTFDPTPVATVELGVRVPMGFHGTFIPASQL